MSTKAFRTAIANLSLEGGLELLIVVAPAAQSKKRSVKSVPVDGPLGAALLKECQASLDHLRSAHLRDFDVRANPTKEEPQLIEAANLNVEAELFALLKSADPDDAAGAHSNDLKFPKLYAVAFGAGDQRFFFVRRKVEALAAGGKLVTRFRGDQLSIDKTPTLLLPVGFEALMHPLGVVLIRGNVFESLFQSKEDVAKEVAASIGGFTGSVTLDAASQACLSKACTSYGYLRKRLRSVVEGPNFAKITPARILQACGNKKLDPATFFNGEEVHLDDDNVDRFLRFVNDEVYRGEFGDELLAADGVAPF